MSKKNCSKQGSEVDGLLGRGGLGMSADGVRVLVDGSGGDHHVVRDVVLKAMVAMWSKTRTLSVF